MASPFTIINCQNEAADIEAIIDIINQYQVERIVVGLPRSMDGSLGKQAEKVEAFAQKLCSQTKTPMRFWDERLTTVAAKRLLQAVSAKKTKQKSEMTL